MPSVSIDGSDVLVRLSLTEHVGAMHGDVRIPLSAVTGVRVSADPWAELRGIRAPGTGWPGVISLCTRRGSGFRDFAAVFGGRPAVVVEAHGAEFDRLVVCCDDPDGVADRIAQAIGRPA